MLVAVAAAAVGRRRPHVSSHRMVRRLWLKLFRNHENAPSSAFDSSGLGLPFMGAACCGQRKLPEQFAPAQTGAIKLRRAVRRLTLVLRVKELWISSFERGHQIESLRLVVVRYSELFLHIRRVEGRLEFYAHGRHNNA
jgi:hypothetical protein